MRQLHPDWPAAAVRSALAGASEQLDGPPLLSGAGRLDVPAAADAAVVADATALSFGLAGTEERVQRTQTLTLANVSAEPADVQVKARAAAGPPVDVSPSLLTLKPGERRAVTVTLAADAPAEDVQGWVDSTSAARRRPPDPVRAAGARAARGRLAGSGRRPHRGVHRHARGPGGAAGGRGARARTGSSRA